MVVYNSQKDIGTRERKSCVALGLFDGLHLGHRAVIGAASELAVREDMDCGVFTFTMDVDGHPAAKPVTGRLHTPAIRLRLLEELGAGFMLCPPFEEFRGLSPRNYVHHLLRDTLNAAHVFCGENYHFGKGAAGNVAQLTELCGELGIEVHTIPLVYTGGEAVSSTRIRAAIAAGDMPVAAQLLGRLFALDFEVIHGRRLGRTLDSPTINQPFPHWFAVPRFGVYASLTTVGGKRHISVSNIGYKPTVGSDRLLSETYIHGFQGDLYGQQVLVELLQFIRPEQKFASVEELRTQIHRDSETADLIGKDLGALPQTPQTF